jgi:hypothetical protein
MSRMDVLRPFIEKNLAALTGKERVTPDASGEYSFPHGSADISVRLLDNPFPIVQLSAVLVSKPRKKVRLLDAINKLNTSELAVRIFKFEDAIMAAWEVPADTLDDRQFRDICARFGETADRLDSDLASRFGGKTARGDEDEDTVDA